MLSKRKPKNSAKNLSATLQVEIDLLVNKLEYKNKKKNPSKPSLLNVLEPSKLLLPTDFLESCLHYLNFWIPQYYPIASAKPYQFLLANP